MTIQTVTPNTADQNPFHQGDRIRKARELSDMDRQTFAALIGVHRDTLRKYEETGRGIKKQTLISVAWSTPARLEWLEDGVLPWAESTSPSTDDDPNLHPSDYKSVTSLDAYRELRKAS